MTLKEFRTKGGHARAASLTKERRIEIAKQGAQARKDKLASKKQETCQSDQNGETKEK